LYTPGYWVFSVLKTSTCGLVAKKQQFVKINYGISTSDNNHYRSMFHGWGVGVLGSGSGGCVRFCRGTSRSGRLRASTWLFLRRAFKRGSGALRGTSRAPTGGKVRALGRAVCGVGPGPSRSPGVAAASADMLPRFFGRRSRWALAWAFPTSKALPAPDTLSRLRV